jgi:hypothetical protein
MFPPLSGIIGAKKRQVRQWPTLAVQLKYGIIPRQKRIAPQRGEVPMRLFAFTLFSFMALLAADALASQPTAPSDANPRAISGSPSPLAGQAAATVTEQPGRVIPLQDYPHWSGSDAKVGRFATFVIRDADEWYGLWGKVGQNPPIAFPRDRMALAIMVGPRPSEGYNIRITEMRIVEDSMVVTYIENKPRVVRPGGLQSSSPWVIKLAPMVNGGVRFRPMDTSAR